MPFSSPSPSLLSITQLSSIDILNLLTKAQKNISFTQKDNEQKNALLGRTQINLFFENSTRTQSSFEIAGKRLGLHVVNFAVSQSSLKKGESLIDTAYTLEAMHPDILVVRHSSAGAAQFFAQHIPCSIINAGDGKHEHPTQALLDALTILEHKKTLCGLNIAICGDILHSRVARSNILCLSKLGNTIRLIAPPSLLPRYADEMGVDVFYDLESGLKNVDIIMVLRLQKERMEGARLSSLSEYYHFYALTEKTLSYAKKDCMVLHPGPMNRGVEISSSVADGRQSFIRKQVEMGVALRMAIIEELLTPSLHLKSLSFNVTNP